MWINLASHVLFIILFSFRKYLITLFWPREKNKPLKKAFFFFVSIITSWSKSGMRLRGGGSQPDTEGPTSITNPPFNWSLSTSQSNQAALPSCLGNLTSYESLDFLPCTFPLFGGRAPQAVDVQRVWETLPSNTPPTRLSGSMLGSEMLRPCVAQSPSRLLWCACEMLGS